MSSSSFSGDETAPFFGFLGAAAALVFSCNSTVAFLGKHFPQKINRPNPPRISLFRHGRGVRDGEEWSGRGVHGSDAAGAGNEVNCTGGYGRSVGDLRADHSGDYQHWNKPQGQVVLSLWWLRALVVRACLWPRWPLSRHGHWDRWWRWSPVIISFYYYTFYFYLIKWFIFLF